MAGNIIGKRYNDLEVLEKTNIKNQFGHYFYKCLCHRCGNNIILTSSQLGQSTRKGCGCRKQEYMNFVKPGQVFNRLTVLEFNTKKIYNSAGQFDNYYWCQCSCNNKTIISVAQRDLIYNHTKSCGCLFKEKVTKHGLVALDRRLYTIYRSLINRCYDDNYVLYPNYGGRGITVCKEWLDNPLEFGYWSLENGYNDSLYINRKNISKGYTPKNTKFGPKIEKIWY